MKKAGGQALQKGRIVLFWLYRTDKAMIVK